MYCLKQACHIDGSFLGDVIALEHIRALVDLIPHFGEAAEKCLSKETVLEHVVSIGILRKNFFMLYTDPGHANSGFPKPCFQ